MNIADQQTERKSSQEGLSHRNHIYSGNPFFQESKYVSVPDKDVPERRVTFQKVLNVKKGDIFGELALISHRRRAATITCMTDCHFAVLDRKNFQIIL